MTKKPFVTVAIPTFNTKRWLVEAIESVLAQTFTDLELLVLDDASTDGTRELMARYEDNPRIEYRLNAQNLGLAGNVHLACRLARGEALVILGADDRLEPRFLEVAVAFLQSYPNVSMVHGPAAWIDREGRRFGGTGQAWQRLTPIHLSMLHAFESGFCFATMLMRTDAIRSTGPLDESWKQVIDLWLFLRMCIAGDIGYLDEVFCEYRVHSDSMSMPMYRTNLMFRQQIAAARQSFSWPEALTAGVAGGRRRAERAAARTAMRVLHMSRPAGIKPMVANFVEILREVPEAALWPRSWVMFGLALLPSKFTNALREYLGRRAVARVQVSSVASSRSDGVDLR